MIIVFIGQRGIPPTYGGVEKYVGEIATRLAAKGHEVRVYCRSRYTIEDKEGKWKPQLL